MLNFSWLEWVLTSTRITKKYIIDPRWWFNDTLFLCCDALTNLSYSAFNSGIHLITIWLEKVKLVFPKKTKQDWHKSILLREGKYNSFFITITIQSSCEKFSGFFFSYIFFFASPSRRLFLMLPNLLALLLHFKETSLNMPHQQGLHSPAHPLLLCSG